MIKWKMIESGKWWGWGWGLERVVGRKKLKVLKRKNKLKVKREREKTLLERGVNERRKRRIGEEKVEWKEDRRENKVELWRRGRGVRFSVVLVKEVFISRSFIDSCYYNGNWYLNRG